MSDSDPSDDACGAPTARSRGKITLAETRQGLDRGEFRLVYQPKVSLLTDLIVGVEALVRWEHPQRGLIGPSEFIAAAEATGIIKALGTWVLREACDQVAAWQRDFRPPISVSINVSAGQFDKTFMETVATAIADSGANVAGVCLEITESMVIDDVRAAGALLAELKTLGVALSIDDFGTGYSSLPHLRDLSFDELKIDKTFVDGIGHDAVATTLAAGMVSLAQALDLDVVAEGVETVDQLERLRAIGCDMAQGYLFAKPLSATAIANLLTAQAAGRRLGSQRMDDPTATPASHIGTVLVVDDASDFRQLVRMAFVTAGFAVAEAVDARTALDQVHRLNPICVLLDVDLNDDTTGIEICRIIRSDDATAEVPVIMLTSHAGGHEKVAAFGYGADDYIVKPVAPRELVSRVGNAIRARQFAARRAVRPATPR